MNKNRHLRVRVSAITLQALDILAQRARLNRSETVRRVLEAEIQKHDAWPRDAKGEKKEPPGRAP